MREEDNLRPRVVDNLRDQEEDKLSLRAVGSQEVEMMVVAVLMLDNLDEEAVVDHKVPHRPEDILLLAHKADESATSAEQVVLT